MGNDLFIPSDVPIESLVGEELEECVYWLLNSLGWMKIEWRKGGDDVKSPDGGRDIEATLFMPSNSGEPTEKRWWFEIKDRSKTIEPQAVKKAVNNALAYEDLDYLTIVTNSFFSNPTRDWLAKWQSKFPVPKVFLWDRFTLELMLTHCPQVVARMFGNILTPQGRLEVAKRQFWLHSKFVNSYDLEFFWNNNKTLEWDVESRIAIITSEYINNQFGKRNWAWAISNIDELIDIFKYCSMHAHYFVAVSSDIGLDIDLFIKSFAYILCVLLLKLDSEISEESLEKIFLEPPKGGDVILYYLGMHNILNHLNDELIDICSYGCGKIIMMNKISFDKFTDFWEKIGAFQREEGERKDKNGDKFVVQLNNMPCEVGFDLKKDDDCPLDIYGERENNEIERLIIFKRIIEKKHKAK